jgi:hypothetical protein
MRSTVPIVVEINLQKGINQVSLKYVDFHFMLFLLMFLLISIGEDFSVKKIFSDKVTKQFFLKRINN